MITEADTMAGDIAARAVLKDLGDRKTPAAREPVDPLSDYERGRRRVPHRKAEE